MSALLEGDDEVLPLFVLVEEQCLFFLRDCSRVGSFLPQIGEGYG